MSIYIYIYRYLFTKLHMYTPRLPYGCRGRCLYIYWYLLYGCIGNKVALAFPRTVRYPSDAPFGPAPWLQSFRRADCAAWSAWSACVHGDHADPSCPLDEAYAIFAKSA